MSEWISPKGLSFLESYSVTRGKEQPTTNDKEGATLNPWPNRRSFHEVRIYVYSDKPGNARDVRWDDVVLAPASAQGSRDPSSI